jgi:hypothetical protein
MFVPEMRRLANQIARLKLGSLEITLRKEVANAFSGVLDELGLLQITIDERRFMPKGDLDQFSKHVESYLARPNQKIVTTLNIETEEIDLPMVYFQSRIIDRLFDLRALLFTHGDAPAAQKRVLGTILPKALFGIIEREYHGIEETFHRRFDRTALLGAPSILDYLYTSWEHFDGELPVDNPARKLRVTRFRDLFAGSIERHCFSYPISRSEYGDLLKLFDSSANHAIFVAGSRVVSVRTIDHVARELLTPILSKLREVLDSEESEGA